MPRVLWRLGAGQALAHDQRQRILERRIAAILDGGETGVAVLVLDLGGEVGSHAGHAVGADRFDAGALGGLEHGARRASFRRELLM